MEIVKNLEQGNYCRKELLKKILTETPGFSMAHLKELHQLGLTREDKHALFNILNNGPDNLAEEMYGKSFDELGLAW